MSEVVKVLVPGRTGWQGQQTSTTGLMVACAILALAVVAYGVVLMSDPAPAMMVLGAGVIVSVALAAWMFVAHMRVSRVRVARVQVAEDTVVFRGAQEVVTPLRALAGGGLLILVGWTWAIMTVPADRLTLLTLLLVPVIGIILTIVGVRAMFGGSKAHLLELSQSGLALRIPRNNLRADWAEVREAQLRGNRVEVATTSAQHASWAAMDFASDPVVLAELVNFYAGNPSARAEIGQGTVQRLSSGEF